MNHTVNQNGSMGIYAVPHPMKNGINAMNHTVIKMFLKFPSRMGIYAVPHPMKNGYLCRASSHEEWE